MYEKEQKLVEGMYPEIVTMLKEITGFERGTKNLPGIRQMAAYMKQRMEALGCEVSELDDPEYGPTLVSRKKGRGKLRAMFYAIPSGRTAVRRSCPSVSKVNMPTGQV